ncbi:glucose-1-phosphate thymidylyltransferase [Elysia marginata]|uniref:Glucose-1-phosphate thymidylyltransferase n=1 Tax=Elysia marginata TaxID=1093978 RepID=A0AAV4GYU2_9GAST|nr:glucose-1-phosphate thymidylyltransferase [Elysia marginata]
MKIVIPMAGRGSRLRPHTLTVPKPLIPIAGKPIVNRLVEDISKVLNQKVDEIAFVIHSDFGDDIVSRLEKISSSVGAKASIYRQESSLGTAHAIMCAKESLHGPTVIAYADTLFRANFEIDKNSDAMVWVKQVNNPEEFGVVQLDDSGDIVNFVEKPDTFTSDLAIIGVYYFKEAEKLAKELQYLLDNDIKKGNEYQLTDGLENMKKRGLRLVPGKVEEWMDCGNKDVVVETNSLILDFLRKDKVDLVSKTLKSKNSLIIQPCYIGENVILNNSKVGPFVSIGKGTVIENSNIKSSLIQQKAVIENANLNKAMIGNHAKFNGQFTHVSIGDYSVLD